MKLSNSALAVYDLKFEHADFGSSVELFELGGTQ